MPKVLDHGYVDYVEHWGSDERIIEAARMSTSKGFKGWEDTWFCSACNVSFNEDFPICECGATLQRRNGDMRLLSFLWKNKHHTPFEMAGVVVEGQAPIFIFWGWQRHRTQSYNELFARYTEVPDLYYISLVVRVMHGE